MAEPFGVGAGIVGVLGLTIQIAQVVIQFGLDWKDAPTDVKSFLSELKSLKTVLSETNANLLCNTDFKEAFENHPSIILSELGPNAPAATETKLSIESCKGELEKLLDELKKRGKGHRIGWDRLKGAFHNKRTRNSIDKLHRQCQLFNNMVSLDATTLVLITQREIRQARREQKEWHNTEQNQKALTWLSNLSFEQKQRDILSKRHPGTGQWLLNLDTFKAWRDGHPNEPSTLWCPGIRKVLYTSLVALLG